MAIQGDFQVGGWRVYPQRNRLQNDSAEVRLEPKVMQVLVELSTSAGQVLSKEALIQSIWPGVYVSEASLTRCISGLRHALNDDPHSPHVIETINKQGYRLMLPVVFNLTAPVVDAAAESEKTDFVPGAAVASPSPEEERGGVSLRTRATRWAGLAFAILLGIMLSVFLGGRFHHPSGYTNFRIIPFTSYQGWAHSPTFSPDGNQIAFIWNGGGAGDNPNLYVKLIGSEPPLRITFTPGAKFSPAWSPDGRWIAFISQSNKDSGIFLVPVIGGEEREIYRLHGAIDWDTPGLSWSPDGHRIIFPDAKTQESAASLYALSLDTHEAEQLTHPDNSWDGDLLPAYSPDGTKIAFVRGADAATRNVYVMDSDGRNPRQLTFHQRQKFGLTWTSDSKSIVFSCDEGGTAALWRVSIESGAPERLPFGTDNAREPAFSPTGDRLAYTQGASAWNMLRVDLQNPEASPTVISSSMAQDSAPKWSPDSKLIAYQSVRSGAQEIWVSEKDGQRPIRLTSFDGPLTGSPHWSPDGQQIAFDSRVDDRSHIFVMSSDGRNKRTLTSGPFNDIIPNWSRDARWIYFGSKRNGCWQAWKVSTSSGEIVQVTRDGGFVAAESYDGRWVYYTKYALPGLWRQPVNGGNEELVLSGPPVNYWGSWCFTKDGIYFADKDNSGWSIRFLADGTRKPVEAMRLQKQPPMFSSLSVSGDKRWLLISDETSSSINIQVVSGLR
jgi:Tol biopolymer transport system component/DNA-binding winged helix-turn-helix (wHTH) protein